MTGQHPVPLVSVVIATYERTESVAQLLHLLGAQTLDASLFEVVVVDDGSAHPAAWALGNLSVPYELVVMRQDNAGPAAARHAGILRARAPLIVILDDDMRVEPGFLADHLAVHPLGSRRAALAPVRAPQGTKLRLFERVQLARIERLGRMARERTALSGTDLYTGNVSFRRQDYLAVGGFDPSLRLSEDAELGFRMEQAGVELVMCDGAIAVHQSDHASLRGWFRRSVAYGESEGRIAAKHGMARRVNPWRYLLLVNPISRPMLLASAMAPSVCRPLAEAVMALSIALDTLGLERVAHAGTTFVYGMLYFAGVRRSAGTRRQALRDLSDFLSGTEGSELGFVARIGKLGADMRADHAALLRTDDKYGGSRARGSSSLLGTFVTRVGFQLLVSYRVMRLFRDVGPQFFSRIVSRLIRHAYAAELHWDADIAPGVIIVHGNGLVISHAARVEAGCVLFQNVTLGESIHPDTRIVGAPHLEADVHVGPGAVLLGPITVGRGTKVAATTVLMHSVPPGSVVESPQAIVRARAV